VALFTFVCGALTGIASGLMPALATTRPDITPALKEDDTIVLRPFRRFGLRNGLVVYQVSAAVMLLLAIGFVVVGSQRGRQLNPGFDMANLYTFALDPPRDGYSASESAVVFGELRRRLARLPDVRAIAYASRPPLSDFMVAADLPIRVPHDGSETVTVNVDRQQVGAGYFAAIGVPVVMGREFTENDQKTDPDPGKVIEPVVINQLAARDMFGSGDPIGKHVRLGAATLEVIGVTRDMRSGFFSAKPVPTVFWPLTTRDFERSSAAGLAVVFTGVGPDPIDAARTGMHAMDPRLTMHRPATLRQLLDQMGTTVRRGNIMNALIGVLAMILAAVGLAGVISHTVARRRHEIGVRMALGARPYQVVRLVVKEGLVMLAVGSMAGFAGALAIANAIGATSSQMADVFSASINDPALSLGVPAVLLVSAAIVCYVPARRSTRIDPAATLRA
jgi:predicted permease